MKSLGAVLALVSATLFAAPSAGVISSCLKTEARDGVASVEIQTNEIMQEDDYKPGYAAEYVTNDGADIGFATSKRGGAVLYKGRLWPIGRSTVLPGAEKVRRPTVRVDLAYWALLEDGAKKYLCVTDAFDGVGRSGSFQKSRYAYILELTGKRVLYFAVGRV